MFIHFAVSFSVPLKSQLHTRPTCQMMIVTTLMWCNVGELHCVIARTRLRRSEDGSPELRVPIQSSDPGPSQARARATRRDAGFGHRSSWRASTARRGIAAQTASPSQHRHAAENKQPGKYSCKNKHGFLKMEIHWLIGASSLCLGWRGWTSELLHSGIILWCGHVTQALHPVTRRALSWHHLSQDGFKMQICLHRTSVSLNGFTYIDA